jgi:hypothetical protein
MTNLKKLIKKIKSCTNCNDHTGALHYLSESLGQADITDALNVIDNEHCRTGDLSPVMFALRNNVKEMLMQKAESSMSSDDFSQIKSAF